MEVLAYAFCRHMAAFFVGAGYQNEELVLAIACIQIRPANGTDDGAFQAAAYFLKLFGGFERLALTVDQGEEYQVGTGAFTSQHPDNVAINVDKGQIIAAGGTEYIGIGL